ncbi:MAG: hypothetical protein ABUL64_02830 [Singulisphaera sp.]
MVIARIVGTAVLTGVSGAVLGSALFANPSDAAIVSLLLGCTGCVIGAVAAAAREIVAAQRQRNAN